MSHYIEHLPAVYRQDPFLDHFLDAFERILTGTRVEGEPADIPRGIEEILDSIHTVFTPDQAPAEFLPWLADWLGASLRDDWDARTRRIFLHRAVALYRKRGTIDGLKEMLTIHTGLLVRIEEPEIPGPHYFRVVITLPDRDRDRLERTVQYARSVIEQEKPAHTWYGLVVEYPILKIVNHPSAEAGPGVVVGRTTVLGTSAR